MFSKHLPGMDWHRLGRAVKEAGFGGVDLTVRPGGHVVPERAAEDMPRAASAIREEGLDVPMITTGLLSASEPAAKPILETAGRLQIPYFKPGYYRYEYKDVRRELAAAAAELAGLARLAASCGIVLGYHNHAGYLGAPVWDIMTAIDPLEPRWAGYYFDPRHAVAEGGEAGWRIATHLVLSRLKMIAVKDFYWEKRPGVGWQATNCPLGEGMVDWKAFFSLVAGSGFSGPVSLHLEYEIPGATTTAQETNTLEAARRDLAYLKARLVEAYGG
jgi:sugar phosphate isomerase/epimerase